MLDYVAQDVSSVLRKQGCLSWSMPMNTPYLMEKEFQVTETDVMSVTRKQFQSCMSSLITWRGTDGKGLD